MPVCVSIFLQSQVTVSAILFVVFFSSYVWWPLAVRVSSHTLTIGFW